MPISTIFVSFLQSWVQIPDSREFGSLPHVLNKQQNPIWGLGLLILQLCSFPLHDTLSSIKPFNHLLIFCKYLDTFSSSLNDEGQISLSPWGFSLEILFIYDFKQCKLVTFYSCICLNDFLKHYHLTFIPSFPDSLSDSSSVDEKVLNHTFFFSPEGPCLLYMFVCDILDLFWFLCFSCEICMISQLSILWLSLSVCPPICCIYEEVTPCQPRLLQLTLASLGVCYGQTQHLFLSLANHDLLD